MPYSLTVKKTEGKPGEVYYPCVPPFPSHSHAN